LENAKVEGNNNDNEVYFTAIQCDGIERAQVPYGMTQKRTFMDMVMIPGGLMMKNVQDDYLRKTHMHEVSVLVSMSVENLKVTPNSHCSPPTKRAVHHDMKGGPLVV
jgi:hypothetical protein